MDQEHEAVMNLEGAEDGEAAAAGLPPGVANPSPRFKAALNLGQLLKKGSATFEVDAEEESYETLFEDGTTHDIDETAYYLKEYFNNPAQQNEAISKSIGVDEALGDFEELLPQMTSITDDEKVKKLVVRGGNGKPVPPDGKVFFNYIAFANGKDEPFDSSIQRGTVEQILLNRGQCVKGLEIALKSMELREISKFWIHYDLCYGKLGAPPRIPAAASCVFTIEILEALDSQKLKNVHFMSRDDRANLPFDAIFNGADEMRKTGTESYMNGQFQDAIKRYRKGIDYLESYATLKYEEDEKRTELLFTLFTNIAQCYLKIKIPAKACTACRLGLKLPPRSTRYKLYYKFAQAKFELGNLEEAENLCKKAIELSPPGKNIGEIKNYLTQIGKSIKRQEEATIPMYRKMFSNPTEKGDGDHLSKNEN